MIKITKKDAESLNQILSLPKGLKTALSRITPLGVELTLHQADELRDLCGVRLQTHGFDENYELNQEGARLEELIDCLFSGSS